MVSYRRDRFRLDEADSLIGIDIELYIEVLPKLEVSMLPLLTERIFSNRNLLFQKLALYYHHRGTVVQQKVDRIPSLSLFYITISLFRSLLAS